MRQFVFLSVAVAVLAGTLAVWLPHLVRLIERLPRSTGSKFRPDSASGL
jgi:hypothetical protein